MTPTRWFTTSSSGIASGPVQIRSSGPPDPPTTRPVARGVPRPDALYRPARPGYDSSPAAPVAGSLRARPDRGARTLEFDDGTASGSPVGCGCPCRPLADSGPERTNVSNATNGKAP